MYSALLDNEKDKEKMKSQYVIKRRKGMEGILDGKQTMIRMQPMANVGT